MEKDKKNKINTSEFLGKISGSCKETCNFLEDHNWILTILFFIAVFIASIWVWYGNILDIQPSQDIVNEFQTKQQDINNRMDGIEKTIEKMQARQTRFKNIPKAENQRDVFESDEKASEDSAVPETGTVQ